MSRWISSIAVFAVFAAAVPAAEITGQYVEARTCDVYTGACFANADTSLTGRNGVLAWRVERGELDGVRLDGLGIVAVLSAPETLGLRQNRQVKSILFVDADATPTQREALIRMAKEQSGGLLQNVMSVRAVKLDVTICPCKEGGCALVKAGDVRIETRCLDKNHDRGCGNDCNFYPPLAKGVTAKAAMTIEHVFSGKDFNETWSDSDRRGAYVGSFVVR